MTLDDVIFKEVAKAPLYPTSTLEKSSVTVEDVVNSTIFLAELLNAGQVYCYALCVSVVPLTACMLSTIYHISLLF